MATTIRTRRHSPTVAADPTGTLVDTETDADDLPGSVSMDVSGWPGAYEVTVTAQKDGERESEQSNGRVPTSSLDVVSVTAWAAKPWDDTQELTLPELVLAAGQRALLMVALEDGGTGFDGAFTFAGLGFTPAKVSTDHAGSGGAKCYAFHANPGAGTYNGTMTATDTTPGASDTRKWSACWVVVTGSAGPGAAQSEVRHLDTASAPEASFSATGAGRLLLAVVSPVDAGGAGTASTGCAIISSGATDAYVVRRTGLVGAGSYTLGIATPTVMDWAVAGVELT